MSLLNKLYYTLSEHKYMKTTHQFEFLQKMQVWHLKKSYEYSNLVILMDTDYADKLLELYFMF